MPRLAVIPSDSIEAYKSKGISVRLKDYYTPLHFFDGVYLLSPLEKEKKFEFGMKIIPTGPRQLGNRVKELGIDIVRAYGADWACDMACNYKTEGVPTVVSVHDTNPELLHNSIKKADIVFCVSEAVRKHALAKFRKPDRVWVLPNRVDFKVMRPAAGDKFEDLNRKYPSKHKILHIGRKEKQKNLDTLIRALKVLAEDYCLVAVGRGNVHRYEELAREQGVIERCYFIESIENEDLARYYSWADCVCVPSRWEGFGIVFIEALACGGVVVTSDIAPMNEYIMHMKNGLLVKDHEDPRALAEAIRSACNDRGTRDALKNNARKSVERFEKDRIDKMEVDYYKKILAMNQNNEFKISFLRRVFYGGR